MAGARLVVSPPPAAAPRVGLLVSALQPSGEGERWGNGVTYDPETGQTGYRTDECDPGGDDRDLDARRDNVEWTPYVVGDGIVCSAMAARGRDWNAQARRQLDAVAEYQISAELWSGTLAQAHGYPNAYLLDDDGFDVGVGLDPVEALAELELYLASCGGGQRGMIHAPRDVVTRWAGHTLLRREGSLILTIHDTIVVPGAGYDGATAVATGMVEVRRGAVVLTGDPLSSASGGIDRTTNLVEVRAEQLALASWDKACHGVATIATGD
jgi:hypothetical protein